MKMTEELFDSIINTAQDCVFWKDKDRRFVGVNQAFLDFYDFDSVDVLLGKTDEDMGWHSDPEPFKQDELRVLQGHSTYKVHGTCMIRGEERDIIASKRPIYDGDEIVGLVGSFVDVTDVLKRQNASDILQIMYTPEVLRKYKYFDKLLDEISMDELLDPLTGVVSRGYFLNFVKSLMNEGTPFSFAIIDLDNFKYINDTYGHHAGDVVLMNVAAGLAESVDGFGIVGRYGGDEMLLVNLRDIDLDSKNRFFEDLYGKMAVLRKNLNVDEHSLFITGTVGCASFPADAQKYEELFALMDKTLYSGKSKGRNCFTVYEHDKHAHLDMKKLAKQGMFTNMGVLTALIEQVVDFEDQLLSITDPVREELGISELLYVDGNYRLRSPIDRDLNEDVSDITELFEDDFYTSKDIDDINLVSPLLYAALKKHFVRAALIAKIGINGKTDGYLICASSRSQRIWQDDERAMIYFIAKSLAAHIRLNNGTFPE